MSEFPSLVVANLRIYWKTLFVILYPLVLLPVFLHDNIPEYRCMYVVLVMAGFWVFEVLPLPVTSLIPMVLFPLMGVLDSDRVSLCYLKETNMMFVGGLIIAIAVEHCHLHRRVALHVIKWVGCSPRKLNLGLCTVTMLVSMWISNTAATAMMIPIIEATLTELEEQGIGEMYERYDLDSLGEMTKEEMEDREAELTKRPTKTTMCYFMSTAYAASIGGNGCIVGSGTNLTFKGIYEQIFDESPGVEFVNWLYLNVPLMILMMYGTLVWMQFWYMGLFRPNSVDAKKIRVGKQGETVARRLITQKLEEMGPMSFHEKGVSACFILSVLLWFFRKPQFITGWAEMITQHKVKDASAALIVVMILFIVPSHPNFMYMFSKDPTKRPKVASSALLTWKVVNQKMSWGLIFLLGGGFALAEASKETGMSHMIASHLHGITDLPKFWVMVISCLVATLLTQFSSNVAVANVVLPVLAEVALVAKIHPMYLMMPCALCCSMAYCLPVSTPPNAIAAGPCNMSSTEMMKVGLVTRPAQIMGFLGLVFTNFKIYWKTLFVVIYPLALLPIFLMNNIPAFRCMYVVLVMAGFWVFEVIPLAVTSLIPMVAFPLMGVLDSDRVSLCYFKETNMMFVGGLIIAISVEHCHLHSRVALHVIKWVGCSPKKLNLGLCTVTMLVSMWISNTAATAMMIPIIEATLTELESQGIGEMYERDELDSPATMTKEEMEARELAKRPTRTTMCYFISTAYAASIGGNGTVVGSGTNLTFKGIYEQIFEDSPGVEFVKWMYMNVPLMIIMMYVTLIWLQFWYMGLFRPNSVDAKNIRIGEQGEAVARNLITQKLEEMGPMSFHEKSVALCFILAVLLWFFRKPQFVTGWPELITDMKVKDASAAHIVVLILFILPSHPTFIHMFSSDPEKRPKDASKALLTWSVVNQKMSWGLIFLLGGGFALAEASKATGMSNLIANRLRAITDLPKFYIMVISCLVGAVLTQFASNVAVANVLLPVLSEIALVAKIHPMYLMMPCSLACSMAYCLPVSTPPNAIAAAPCNMSSPEMIKVGLGVVIIGLGVLFGIFPLLAPLIWDMHNFPEWAIDSSKTTTAKA